VKLPYENDDSVHYSQTLKDILLSRIVQDGLVKVEALDAPMDPVAITAQRIAGELETLQEQHSQLKNGCRLQALEAACIENNVRALEIFCCAQYGRLDSPQNAYAALIKILHEIRKGVEPAQLGRNPTMISAHTLTGKKGSKTLETARYELLLKAYLQLLAFENGQRNHEDEPELSDFKKGQTIWLVRLLMLGVPEGQFPHAANTFLADACTVFFDKIWVYFSNVFYNRPLSVLTAFGYSHYDIEFYEFCKKLLVDQKIVLWESFDALKKTHIDPQYRLVELFRSLNSMIDTKILLTADQLQFKILLKKIAKSYGFEESDVKALSYNTCQKGFCDARERWGFLNAQRNQAVVVAVSPEKKPTAIEMILSELLGTEFNFLREMNKFVGSDDARVRASLKKLVSHLSCLNLSDIERKQIKIIENFYVSLFESSGRLYEALFQCMRSESNLLDKLNVLFSDIIGNNKHDFTDFMLRLVISSIFAGKFVQVLKPLLDKSDPSAMFAGYEDTMTQSFQLLSKIKETLKALVEQIQKRKLDVVNEEQYERHLTQAQLMCERVCYFLSVAEKLRLLICDQKEDSTLLTLLDDVRDEYYRGLKGQYEEELESSPRIVRSKQQHFAQRLGVTDDDKGNQEKLLSDLKQTQLIGQLQDRRGRDADHPMLLKKLQDARRAYHERRQAEFESCLGINNDHLFFEHCPRWLDQWQCGELRIHEVLQILAESISSDHEEMMEDQVNLVR